MALSHSLIKENLRRINCRRLSSFSSFSTFPLSFFHLCFVISSVFFVVFPLSLIRERCGALLFALNEESAVKVIDVSFLCVVKTQRRWSNKIYKTELTKTRYNNQVLGKYRLNPQSRVDFKSIVDLVKLRFKRSFK